MAPQDCQAPNSPIQQQVPSKTNADLLAEYPEQSQLQQELAIISDEECRLELAKAFYEAQIAVERKAQRERVKKMRAEEKAEQKRRRAEIARLLRGAGNESTGPMTRSQVKKAAELVDDDGDEVLEDQEYAAESSYASLFSSP